MPGMILTNSAAFCPTIATFCRMCSLIRVDFSPDSVGVIWTLLASTTTVSFGAPGSSLIPVTFRLSSELRTIDFAAHVLKFSFSTNRVSGGRDGSEGKVPFGVTDRTAQAAARFVLQSHRRIGNDGTGGVKHSSGQGRAGGLPERRRLNGQNKRKEDHGRKSHSHH